MDSTEYDRGIEAVCDLVIKLWDSSMKVAQCYDVTSLRLLPLSEKTPYQTSCRTVPSKPDRYELQLAPLKNGGSVFSLTGAAICLPNTEPHIQRAVMMHNHCVTSWVVLRDILTKLLHIVAPNIRMELVYVVPEPLVEIHVKGRSPASRHSIFHIITPYRTFVLDPTGEQLGFKREKRLSEKEDYLRRCVCPIDQCIILPWKPIGPDEFRQQCSDLEELAEDCRNNFWEETMIHLTTVVDEWENKTRGGIRKSNLFSDDEKEGVLKSFRMKMNSDKMRSWSRQ